MLYWALVFFIVAIVAPHTSNWDFIVGVAAVFAIGVPGSLSTALLMGAVAIAVGGELHRDTTGEVPVDRAARPVHELLQLGEQRHLPHQVLRGAAGADAAEERPEAERVPGRAARAAGALVPALRVAVGVAEAERHVTHGSTVDA